MLADFVNTSVSDSMDLVFSHKLIVYVVIDRSVYQQSSKNKLKCKAHLSRFFDPPFLFPEYTVRFCTTCNQVF